MWSEQFINQSRFLPALPKEQNSIFSVADSCTMIYTTSKLTVQIVRFITKLIRKIV